eukprot:1555944-Alexandrium_andersonii.AAC.1
MATTPTKWHIGGTRCLREVATHPRRARGRTWAAGPCDAARKGLLRTVRSAADVRQAVADTK